MKYFLAVDIGASSGRLILAHMDKGKMVLEEMHRFPNGNVRKDGHLIWDVDGLFTEIKNGMKKCAAAGKIPFSMGIDTWAVDFVLLDGEDRRIGDAVAYRDGRTQGMDEKVYGKVSKEDLYAATGIQKQPFNSIYQLMAVKKGQPQYFEKAEAFLMIPDYLNFLLTGVKKQEYTNATTTQLVNAKTGDWDWNIIDKLGFKKDIFLPIEEPGSKVGNLRPEVAEEVGFDCSVVLPATHDTGSAVAAVPVEEGNVLYISSGTWSLMGTELKGANCTPEAMEENFTNEGGYGHTVRFLKNIMGLWMIQSVKKEIGGDLSFEEICDRASKCSIGSLVDANDNRFLAPLNMTDEVKKACAETGQQVPEGIDEVAAVIYNSLAVCYAKTVKEVESRTGLRYDAIHVVGGGANAKYLNELTAAYTDRIVLAGPTEATAIGNIAVQMIADGQFKNIGQARKCIFDSFEIKKFEKKQTL